MTGEFTGRDMSKATEAGVGFYLDPQGGTPMDREAGLAWLKERAADSDRPLAIMHEGHHHGQPCTARCFRVGVGLDA